MEVTVRKPGLQTTVQDLGRPGYRAEGVPLGGAVDRFAFRVANLLVGNEDGAPALEFALRGPELTFDRDALVAVTGGDFEGLPSWQPVQVAAGSTVRFGLARTGCRGYLAVAGGFSIPPVLGSAGTYLRGRFGGLDGRSLREGDTLSAPNVHRAARGHWWLDRRILPAYSAAATVRVIRGAQAEEFRGDFFATRYQVSAQSDRMGARLKGPVLERRDGAELRSTPLVPGTIQVPPDGQPILLLADAQTIGGYPQIAHVIDVDLPVAAQLRPGDSVRFVAVAVQQAHELTLARERALAMLRQGLSQKFV